MPLIQDRLGVDLFERRSDIDNGGLSSGDFMELIEVKAEEISNPESIHRILDSEWWIAKLWIDPTGSDIHLWHAVTLNFLRLAQNAWLNPVFIIWTLTALVWDPTWRNTSRPKLSRADIKNNIEWYTEQASKIINMDNVDVVHNDELNRDVDITELMGYFSNVTLAKLMQRSDFRARQGNGLTLAEICYPLLMALDSVKLHEQYWQDIVELWGKDQLLNFQVTKELMAGLWLPPEEYMTSKLLPWINWSDKMSKSLNNYIWLNDSPWDIFMKIMAIPDDLILTYYTSFADIFPSEVGIINGMILESPYELKTQLAILIVSILHGSNDAEAQYDVFSRRSSNRQYQPEDFDSFEMNLPISIVDGLSSTELFDSNKAIKRLLRDNSVKKITLDGETSTLGIDYKIEEATYLKVGKKLICIKPIQ